MWALDEIVSFGTSLFRPSHQNRDRKGETRIFQRALELDADYAPPLEGLARAYSLAAVGLGYRASLESMPKAKDFALRAIAAIRTRVGLTTLGFVIRILFIGRGGSTVFARRSLNP